jgi:hypothetical protein
MMTLVWEVPLADSEKIVLLALADCANDEGHCWPSMATLAKKCSKSDRTVQACIQTLCSKGHLTRREVPGRGCNYTVHPIVRLATPEAVSPRSGFAPEAAAPRRDCATPPKPIRDTPEAASDKPSKNHKEPSKRRVRAPIPDDWQPKPFAEGTKSRQVMDSWPDGELEAQLEQFKANHRGKGNTFFDPQDAWQTWVLNTRKFGIGKAEQKRYVSKSGYEYRGDAESVMREAERRGDNDTYWKAKSDRNRKAASVGDVAGSILKSVRAA